jgi:hypothetical protein
MYTLHCQIGMILSLTLARDAGTGHTDWHSPEIQLVYNVQRDRAAQHRRLVLLESYLRERERAGDHCRQLRRLAEILYYHVLGL